MLMNATVFTHFRHKETFFENFYKTLVQEYTEKTFMS